METTALDIGTFSFVQSIKTLWQKNNLIISGERWHNLVSLFREHLIQQYDSMSRRFASNDLSYSFLAEESVCMNYHKDRFLKCVFGVSWASNRFSWEVVNSRLKASISLSDFTSLCAAVHITLQSRVKPELHNLASSSSKRTIYTRSNTQEEIPNNNEDITLTVKRVRRRLDSNVLSTTDLIKNNSGGDDMTTTGAVDTGKSKTKLEAKRESVLSQFIEKFDLMDKHKSSARTPKDLFRLHLIDYMHTQRVTFMMPQPVLDELIFRLYPSMLQGPSDEYYYGIAIMPKWVSKPVDPTTIFTPRT